MTPPRSGESRYIASLRGTLIGVLLGCVMSVLVFFGQGTIDDASSSTTQIQRILSEGDNDEHQSEHDEYEEEVRYRLLCPHCHQDS